MRPWHERVSWPSGGRDSSSDRLEAAEAPWRKPCNRVAQAGASTAKPPCHSQTQNSQTTTTSTHIVVLVARRNAHDAVPARRERLGQRLHHVAQAACERTEAADG